VKFDLAGFQSSETPDVVLLLGKTLAVDSSLKVGGVQEQVSVTAESPLIDTKNTTIAHNVTAEEIDRIPKGRSFQNLALASGLWTNVGQIADAPIIAKDGATIRVFDPEAEPTGPRSCLWQVDCAHARHDREFLKKGGVFTDDSGDEIE
jgi:hypothetical protein